MGPGSRRALLAAALAAPLAALGVCGSIAALAPPAAVCEAPPDGGCCPRSGAPLCPRPTESGSCASCGAATCARLTPGKSEAAPTRRDRPSAIVSRPAAVQARTRLHRAASLVTLSESPPKNVLLATFRN